MLLLHVLWSSQHSAYRWKQCEGGLHTTFASFHVRDVSGVTKHNVARQNIDPDQRDGGDLSTRLGNRHDAVCSCVVD